MAGLGDLFGENGALEQILLWGVVSQVISAVASPAFTALTQDVNGAHPEMVLSPDIIANAVVRGFYTDAAARAEAAKSGIAPSRFEVLRELAQVHIQPADLAEAVLRSYMTAEEAQDEAEPQGWDAGRLAIMTNLAGDAPGADQLAEALRRGIITRLGKGANSTSYEQGIAETRLHDKWGPVLEALSVAVLPPADAADAVVRNFLTDKQGAATAALSGVTDADFEIMRHLAGDAPGPQQLAEALRRGAIDEFGTGAGSTSFEQGIAEGRLADKWAPVIKVLAQLWPTPVDALNALLKGQLTHAEAEALYVKLGGDPQFFDILYNTQGEAPTPLELIEMANRGYIPWNGLGPEVVSYEQGFKEGHWRNKWSPVYERFAQYVPPPSTVLTMVERGSITDAQAAKYLAQQGMDKQLISDMLFDAHLVALSPYRALSAQTVLNAYKLHILDNYQARAILAALHVGDSAIDLMLEYADLERGLQAVSNAVSRIRSLYAARKITTETARSSLDTLGLPQAEIDKMMAAWSLENSISVRVLTEAQIVAGWEIGVFTPEEALTELENIGYTPFDAWALLSIKVKAPLDGKPRQGPAAPQGQVVPGTT